MSLQPIVKALLTISITLSAVLTSVWVYLAYLISVEGAPVIIFVIMPVLIAIGFALIGILVYALFKAPMWIKRFEQKFFGEN
jgi:uncharacterized membrane protein